MRIKMELFPADEVDVDTGLAELQSAGFITRYMIDASRFIEVSTFTKHQNPHHREPDSFIPPPPRASPGQASESPGHIGVGNGGEPQALCACTAGEPRASPELAVLIPDSLNPEEKHCPASVPDDAQPKVNGYKHTAREILSFLNEKAKRRYEPVDANLEPIIARLKEGSTADDLRAVVAMKCREWIGNEDMAKYLRPETLFSRKKFAGYKGQLNHEVS